jgi:hypothetical protein
MQLSRNILKKLQAAAVLALALAASVADQSTAQAGDQVPFRASYDLELQMIVDLPFGHITSTGEAIATHLGLVTAHSVEETINLLTGEGVATHQFTGANGDAILVDFVFTAIPTSETVFVVNGAWQISGGTGRFDGASGSGTYAGRVEFTGPNSAVGHFKLEGTISSSGT